MDGRPIGGAAPLQAARPKTYTASGLIEKIGSDSITLNHGPVAALNWPSMTMRFRLADPAKARGFKAGDRVGFPFDQPPAGPTVRHMTRALGRAPWRERVCEHAKIWMGR